jgi:hypothetical protein
MSPKPNASAATPGGTDCSGLCSNSRQNDKHVARTELSCQYVDHNLIQEDHKNPDDHLFLLSACQRFGIWYSRAGNGVSHPVHQERFGKPGKTMLGSDSHTPAAGAIGMLAIGAGGLEVAMAIAGEPFYVEMPSVWGIRLTGTLPDWVSAKDVILEMLRRHKTDGGKGRIIEYFGAGLTCLSAMEPATQIAARRYVPAPSVHLHRLLFHPSWPQTFHQESRAIFFCWRVIHSFDLDLRHMHLRRWDYLFF